MIPEGDDPDALRREITYYRRQLDEVAGENVKLDVAIMIQAGASSGVEDRIIFERPDRPLHRRHR